MERPDLEALRNKIVMVAALIHADDCESKDKHTHRCNEAHEVLGLYDALTASLESGAPALRWTREAPKAEGWYWYQPPGKKAKPGVGHVWPGLFGELRLYVGEPTKVGDCEGLWAGPLPEPTPEPIQGGRD